MEFEIVNGSDLLSKKAYLALSKDERKAYDKAAKAFADQFNAKYPDGKFVRVAVEKINEGERVNIIVRKHADLSTQVFGFPYSVTDAIARDLGLGNTLGLTSILHSSLEEQHVELTVRAVVTGDTFTDNNGKVHEYTAPAMVKLEGTKEVIILSDDANDILAEIHTDLLKDSIREAAKNRRRGKKAEKTVAVASDGGDAEDDDTDV